MLPTCKAMRTQLVLGLSSQLESPKNTNHPELRSFYIHLPQPVTAARKVPATHQQLPTLTYATFLACTVLVGQCNCLTTWPLGRVRVLRGVLGARIPCRACRKILLVARSVTLALSCLGISLGQPTREYMALPSDGSAPSGLRLGTMLRSDA